MPPHLTVAEMYDTVAVMCACDASCVLRSALCITPFVNKISGGSKAFRQEIEHRVLGWTPGWTTWLSLGAFLNGLVCLLFQQRCCILDVFGDQAVDVIRSAPGPTFIVCS